MRTISRKTQTPSRHRSKSQKTNSGELPKAKTISLNVTRKHQTRSAFTKIAHTPESIARSQTAKTVSTKVTTKSGACTRNIVFSSKSKKKQILDTSSKSVSKANKVSVSPHNTRKIASLVSGTRSRSESTLGTPKKIKLAPASKVRTSSRVRMNVSGQQEVRPEIDPPHQTIEVSANTNGGAAHQGGSPSTSSSPKKLKGSLSIKFKSWNWDKQKRPSQVGMLTDKTFDSSEGEEDEASDKFAEQKPLISEKVVTQNNQTLQKCPNCLLYIPVESFERHGTKDCESLHIEGQREYICSECLACYSSQKFLVRHKRECPKRNQNYTLNHSRYPKSVSQPDLDNMYSVVWKCHCKKNFTSAEELAKHRHTCISAQQYTATCPICNARMMGGSRTLRYHMTQHHASLFMSDETSSSSVLGNLQGTSPVHVITTQTSNIGDLVKKLSKEHTGANIRVVSVNSNQKVQQHFPQSPVQRQPTPRQAQSAPEVAKQNAEVMHQGMEVMAEEVVVSTAATSAADARKRRSSNIKDEQESTDEQSADAEPMQKRTRMSPRGKGGIAEVETPKQAITRAKGSISESEMSKQPDLKRTVTRSKAVEVEVNASAKQPGTRSRSPRSRQTESQTPVEVKTQEVKAGTHSKTKGKKGTEVDNEEEMQIEGSNAQGDQKQEDLENLLVKAKALTKELEDKLASQSPKTGKVISEEVESDKLQTPTGRDTKKKNESECDSNIPMTQDNSKESMKSAVGIKPDVNTQRSRRRYAQVTCLDCQQIFKDYIELGRHKRTDCPVVISQHLSADGNFTEKVDMFQEGKQAKQQKLDVVECYYCTLCNSKFKLRSQVYEHMRFEHKNRGLGHYLNYHCPYCPRVFQTTKQRHEHKQERHNDIRLAPDDDFTIKETVVCNICFQVVPKWDKDKHDASECRKHVQEVESDTFCQLCGVLCQTQDQLKHHRQVEHLNAIHFRCGQCTRTFGHAVELRCHKVSHHTKNPRWEQNLSLIKSQEARKGSPGPQKVRIHISPSVEEVKNPGTRPRVGSPTKISLPTDVRKPTTNQVNQPTDVQKATKVESSRASSTPDAAVTRPNGKSPQVGVTKSTPRATAIRFPAGGGPLSLTPQQMKNLSQGQPIKLVVPKDADMKNLSFTVPGEDGKPKKFSVTPKFVEGQKASTNVKENVAGLGTSAASHTGAAASAEDQGASPQRELAAALGLQPKGPGELVQAPAKHRPTRLRSGRTIDNKGGVATSKKDAEKVDAQKTDGSQSDARTSIRGKKTAKEEVEKNEVASPRPRMSARIEAKVDKRADDKNNTPEPKKTRTSARKEAKEEKESANIGLVETESTDSLRIGTKKAKDDGSLAPVQVLKPVGKDLMQCMRCNTVLHSMMEVASHHCNK